jgi:large repetitive protein
MWQLRLRGPIVLTLLAALLAPIGPSSFSPTSTANANSGWQIQLKFTGKKPSSSQWPSDARLTAMGSPGTSGFEASSSASTGASSRNSFSSGEGLYDAFFTQKNITKIAFVDGSGNLSDPTSHSNYLIYDLVGSTGNESINEILKRLDLIQKNNPGFHGSDNSNRLTLGPSVTNFTAGINGYSGTLVQHGGNGFRTNDASALPDKFAIMGVNIASDNDIQALAAYSGNLESGKGDAWRGQNPAQTFWSYWGHDFHSNSQTQRIGSSLQTAPGVATEADWTGNVFLLAYGDSGQITVPEAPSITSITPASEQLSVAFNAPQNNGGATIINYEYSIDDGETWVTPNPSVTTTPLLISSGLTNGSTFDVRLRAVNSEGSGASSAASAAVPRAALTFTTPTSGLTGATGSPFSLDATITGGHDPTFSITAGTLPVGLSLNASSGLISGTPIEAGSYPITLRVTDGVTTANTNSFTISISGSQGLSMFVRNQSGRSQDLARVSTTSGLPGLCGSGITNNLDYNWGTGRPTVNSTTLNSCGENSFTVYAKGSITAPTTGTVTFCAIADDGFFLRINNSTVINNWVDQGTNSNCNARGTMTMTEGAVYPIEVWHHENAGGAVMRLLWSYSGQELTAVPSSAFSTGLPALSIQTPSTGLAANRGVSFSLPVVAIGGSDQKSFTLTGTLPAGLTLSPSTGVISGVPTATGSSTVSVTVSSAGATATTSTFTISVGGVPDVPTAPVLDTATVQGDGRLKVSWTAPADNGRTITDFEVRYALDGVLAWSPWVSVNGIDASASTNGSVVIAGLQNARRYVVQVRAINGAGTSGASPVSNAFEATGAPAGLLGAPINRSVTTSDRQITINFTENPINTGAGSSEVLFNTLNESCTNESYWIVRSNVRYAHQFTAGSGGVITKVEWRMGAGLQQYPSQIKIVIFSDNNGSVGTALGEFAFSSASSNISVYTGSAILQNGGTYWIEQRPTAAIANHYYCGTTSTGASGSADGWTQSRTRVANGSNSATWSYFNGTNYPYPMFRLTSENADAARNAISEYQYSLDGGTSWRSVARASLGAGPSLVIPNLTNGTTYEVRLRAVNAAGPGAILTLGTVRPGIAPSLPREKSLRLGDVSGQILVDFKAPLTSGGSSVSYQYRIKDSASVPAEPTYYPSGPQNNVAVSTITDGGWTLCWNDQYRDIGDQSRFLNACTGKYILVAAGAANDPGNYMLAAAGERSSVFRVTGINEVTSNNGTFWYFNPTRSMGFAPTNVIRQSSADVQDRSSTLRMSWHLGHCGVGKICGGWRVGSVVGLNGSTAYVRAIYSYSGSDLSNDTGWGAWTNIETVTVTGETITAAIRPITNDKTYAVQIRATSEFGQSPSTVAQNIDSRRASGPTITSQPISQNLTLNQSAGLTLSVSATASGGEVLTYQWYKGSTLLPGETQSTYSLSGPINSGNQANFAGIYYVTVTGTLNGTAGISTSDTATVTVNPEPTIPATPAPGNGTVDSPYQRDLVVDGGSAPFTWSLAPGSRLPSGLTLSSSGRISGTPTMSSTQAASSAQQVSGSDALKNANFASPLVSNPTQGWAQVVRSGGNAVIGGGGLTFSYGSQACTTQSTARMGEVQQKVTISTPGTVTFSIKVDARLWNRIGAAYNNPCHDPYQVTLTSSRGTSATTGRIFSTSNVTTARSAVFDDATNLWRTVTVSLTTTTANEEVTISLFGLDSGYWAGNYGPKFYDASLTVPGSSSSSSNDITFRVTDANGKTAQRAFPIQIDPALAITTRVLANAAIGANYSESLTAQGGSGIYQWAVVGGAGALPSGITLTSDGLLGGTVQQEAVSKSFTVSATDGNGATVTQSLSITVASSLPGVVDSLTVVSVASQSILLSWDTTTTNGGTPVSQYIITYSAPKGSDPNDSEDIDQGIVTVSASGLSFPYTLSGLKNGRTYTLSIKARNVSATGNASAEITAKPATTPSAVRNLSASLANGGLALRWRVPERFGGNPATSYQVQCRVGTGDWILISDRVNDDGSGNVSVVASESLTVGSTYNCRVAAVTSTGVGEFAATAQSVKLAKPPAIPGGAVINSSVTDSVTAVISPGRMTVSWSRSSDDGGETITSYIATVVRDVGTNREITRSCSVAANLTDDISGYSCVVQGIPKKGSFRVTVTAINGIGSSPGISEDISEAGDPQTLTIPSSPRNFLAASGNNPNPVAIPLGSADFSIGATMSSGLPVQYSVAQSASTVCSLTARGLVKLLSLGNCLVVLNQNGDDARGVATDFAPITPETVVITVSDRIPGAPRISSVTSESGSVTINWSAPTNTGGTPTGYQINWAPVGTSFGTDSVTVGLVLTRAITGLTNGTAYKLRIRSLNSGGESEWVEYRGEAEVAGTPAKPAIDAVVVEAANGSATVQWSVPSDTGGASITNYEVTSSGNGTSQSCIVGGATLSCIFYGLVNKNDYDFVLVARNRVGSSVDSDTYTARVDGLDQTISLLSTPAFDGWAAGGANYQIQATSNSGAALTFTTSDASVCTVTNTGSVGFLGAGTCTVTISQDGVGTRFNAADNVAVGFSVSAALPSAPSITGISSDAIGLTLTWSAPVRPGSAITGYRVVASDGDSSYTWVVGNVTTMRTSQVSKGVLYSFTVTAVNSAGSGETSDAVSASWTTVADAPSLTGVTLDPNDGRTLIATWNKSATDGGTPVLRYIATAAAAGETSVTCAVVASGDATQSCSLDALKPGVAYSVTVLAENAVGNSLASSAIIETPGIDQVLTVSAPSSSVAKNFGDGNFRIVATLDSGNNPLFASSDPSVCTVDATGMVAIMGVGSCAVTVSHPGSTPQAISQYKAASSQTISITVSSVAPTAPTLISATLADTAIAIALTPSSTLGGGTLTTYEYSLDDGVNWITPDAPITTDNFTVLVPQAGSYAVRVRTMSSASLASSASNSILVAPTVSNSPDSLTVTATLTGTSPSIVVNWRSPLGDGGSSITGYQVTATSGASSVTCETNRSTFTCTLTGLNPGLPYSVSVVAINGIGNSSPATASITTIGKPGAPTGITVVENIANARVTISWTAPASDGGSSLRSYEARAYLGNLNSPADLFCSRVHSNGENYSCTISGLQYKTGYIFAVAARNAVATSDLSIPSNLVTLVSSQAITFNPISDVTWSTRSITVRATSSAALPLTLTASPGSVCTISGQRVSINGLGECSITAEQSGEGTAFSAAPSVTRSFAVTATRPSATTLLSVIPLAGKLDVAWSPVTQLGGSASKTYLVSYASNPEFSDELSLTTVDTFTTLTGLTPGTTYNVRVKVITPDYETGSAWSNFGRATVLGVPETPQGETVTVGAGTITVQWQAVDAAASGGSPILGYRVSAYLGLGDENPATCITTDLSCVIGGLDGSSFYTVKIFAFNAVGDSVPYEYVDDYQPSASQIISAPATETVNRSVVKRKLPAAASSGLPLRYSIEESTPTNPVAGRSVCTVDPDTGEITFDLAGVCKVKISQDGRGPGRRPSAFAAAQDTVTTITVQPDVPGNVVDFDISSGNGSLTVSWAKPAEQNDGGAGISGYEVTWFATRFSGSNAIRETDADIETMVSNNSAQRHLVSDPDQLSYQITGLTNGDPYTVIVKTINRANLKSQRS